MPRTTVTDGVQKSLQNVETALLVGNKALTLDQVKMSQKKLDDIHFFTDPTGLTSAQLDALISGYLAEMQSNAVTRDLALCHPETRARGLATTTSRVWYLRLDPEQVFGQYTRALQVWQAGTPSVFPNTTGGVKAEILPDGTLLFSSVSPNNNPGHYWEINIDLTNVSTLVVRNRGVSNWVGAGVAIFIDDAQVLARLGPTAWADSALDVSSYTGIHAIRLWGYANANADNQPRAEFRWLKLI